MMRRVLVTRGAQAVIWGACLLGALCLRVQAATGDINTVAGTGAIVGPNSLDLPSGVACDAAGNLYVCDTQHSQVVRIDVVTKAQTQVIGSLNFPTGILVDKFGNIFVSVTGDNQVIRKDSFTGVVTVYAGDGSGYSFGDPSPISPLGTFANFAGVPLPGGLAMDSQGNLYISQISATPTDNLVRRVDFITYRISTVVGSVTGLGTVQIADNAIALNVQLNMAGGNSIFVDLADNIYVADLGNFVFRVNSDGFITVVAGTGTPGHAVDGGLAIKSTVSAPASLAVDLLGNVFFSSFSTPPDGGYVHKVDALTGVLSHLTGQTNSSGFSGDGGLGTSAKVDMLFSLGGLCLDTFGNVIFSDVNNNRVRSLSTVGYGTPPSGNTLSLIINGSVDVPFSKILLGSSPLPKKLPYIQTSSGGLPPGLVLTGDVLSGTPTTIGLYLVTYRADAAVMGSLIFRVYFLISPAGAGTSGGGPQPIPSFIAAPNGGTSPVDVILNPFDSYLPVSTDPSQKYLYLSQWDFGDGTSVVSGDPVTGDPSSIRTDVLASVLHTYGKAGSFVVRQTIFMTIQILNPVTGLPVIPAQAFSGPTIFSEKQVKIANYNYPPGAIVFSTGSPIQGDGSLPFNAQVTPSFGQDTDGYLAWAAIDWGDGTSELIPNPPTLPAIINLHAYTTPGLYKVTVSVIDNGRIPLGTVTPLVPLPNDPQAALQYFVNLQSTLAITSFDPKFFNILVNPSSPTGMDKRFQPQMRQDFILIQVPGNMNGVKGSFQLDFAHAGRDTFDEQTKLNVQLNTAAGVSTTVTLGSGASAMTKTFVTDRQGKFKDKTGFTFSFDTKKQIATLHFAKTLLAPVLGVSNATVVNGNVDVPLKIVFNGEVTLATVARFAYNAKQSGKGTGKGGLSKNFGN